MSIPYTELVLPNGIGLSSALDNAMKMAKERRIPLSEAKNCIAWSISAGKSWDELVSQTSNEYRKKAEAVMQQLSQCGAFSPQELQLLRIVLVENRWPTPEEYLVLPDGRSLDAFHKQAGELCQLLGIGTAQAREMSAFRVGRGTSYKEMMAISAGALEQPANEKVSKRIDRLLSEDGKALLQQCANKCGWVLVATGASLSAMADFAAIGSYIGGGDGERYRLTTEINSEEVAHSKVKCVCVHLEFDDLQTVTRFIDEQTELSDALLAVVYRHEGNVVVRTELGRPALKLI